MSTRRYSRKVQGHDDVRHEPVSGSMYGIRGPHDIGVSFPPVLDLYGLLGGEQEAAAVHWGLEGDALLGDLGQVKEAHHLSNQVQDSVDGQSPCVCGWSPSRY